jgi:hypothetical protein
MACLRQQRTRIHPSEPHAAPPRIRTGHEEGTGRRLVNLEGPPSRGSRLWKVAPGHVAPTVDGLGMELSLAQGATFFG